jgi:hypothetical protein
MTPAHVDITGALIVGALVFLHLQRWIARGR